MHRQARWTAPVITLITLITLCACLLFCFLAAAAIPSPPQADDPLRAAPIPEHAWLLQPQPLRPALRAPLTAAVAESINRHGGLLLIGLSPQFTLPIDAPCTLSVTLAGFTQHHVIPSDLDQASEDTTLISFPLWSGGGDPRTPLLQARVTPEDALTLRTSDACQGLLLGAALFLDEAAADAQADPSSYWEGALITLPVAPPPPAPSPDTPEAPNGDALAEQSTLWAGF